MERMTRMFVSEGEGPALRLEDCPYVFGLDEVTSWAINSFGIRGKDGVAGKVAGKSDLREKSRIGRRELGAYLFVLEWFFVEPAVGIEPTTC
jgi:hypothetical protein